MTRIISGRYGGLKLLPLKHDIRPTTDRVKEYIFNVCPYFEEKEVLDLFSGSGGLGLEALSRGAIKAVFVDKNFKSIDLVKKNIQHLKITEKVDVYKRDVINYIKKDVLKSDVIFADPPYKLELSDDFFNSISGLLKSDGMFIFEYHSRWEAKKIKGLTLWREKKFGETGVWIYEKQ